MNKKTCLLLLAVSLLTQVHTQTVTSGPELEARGTWLFWPYKIETDGTVESTLKFANGNAAARFADSSRYAPVANGSISTPLGPLPFGQVIDYDYVKGAVIVFAWNWLQYKDAENYDEVPNYNSGGNDLIRYKDFYQAIQRVVEKDNIKGYGIEIWTGHWAPMGDPEFLGSSPYWLSQSPDKPVKRIKQTEGAGANAKDRYYPDYLNKGYKRTGTDPYPNNYSIEEARKYPSYVTMGAFTNTDVTTYGANYKDDDYTRFGNYTCDKFAETNYEYWYRNFLYRIIQYLCNLKTTPGSLTAEEALYQTVDVNVMIKNKLLFFQFGEGTTGDLRPWQEGDAFIDEAGGPKVNMDLDQDIDAETEWPIFVRKHWGWLANALYDLNDRLFTPTTRPLPNVHLLFNGGNGSKVWGKKAADNNPGLNNLPRTPTINFNTPSSESYFLWPVSSVGLGNINTYTGEWSNVQRLTRNWYKRRYNGSTWGNTPAGILNYMYQSWRKPPEGGHLYNMNFGKQYRDIYKKLKYDQLGSIAENTKVGVDGVIRYRDECDWNNNDLNDYPTSGTGGGYDIESLRKRTQHLFATATSSLDFGLDYWIQYRDMLTYVNELDVFKMDDDNAKVFTFFNQHVQDYDYSNKDITKTPKSSYLAFKDGLDGNDYTRFNTEDLAIQNEVPPVLAADIKSSVDAGGANGNIPGERYTQKIATNRNLGQSNIYNQNTLQSVSDIAQGGAGNQYNRNGAGQNDVGWFVTTDNDGAIIQSGTSTKLTMQEVSSTGTTSYKAAQVGYYNIMGKTTFNSEEVIDKSSMFGRFSKGVVSPNMAGNTSGLFYQKASTVYIKLGNELRSNIYNNNSPRDVYIAITWFGSMEYNGGSANDATNHKLRLTIQSNDCTLKTFNYDFNRFITSSDPNPNPTDRKRWYTVVYKVTNWFVFPVVSNWDFAISNNSGSADVSIQLGMVEVFIGNKPDYITDGLTQTKSYYTSALTTATATNPFADNNITLADVTPPPQNNCNWLIGGGGDSAKSNSTGWDLYPNPATNHTAVKINKACKSVTITIQDITGKILHTQTAGTTSAGQVIGINQLPAVKGTYIVMLQADGERSYKKLVVE